MTHPPEVQLERRLLILAPIGKDAALIETMLCDAAPCLICPDLECLTKELERGAGAIILTEESLAARDTRLTDVIARQPPWSDIPVLLLTRQGADSWLVRQAMETLGNVALLERPVRIVALTSAVQSALRARDRQYQIRRQLEERELADRRKDEFLATLAHELRNPLAPLRNSLDLLRMSGVATPLWQIMERQVGHMVRLVDDLLEVSRITRGKIELRKEAVDLGSVINAAVETSRPLIEAAGHQFTVTLPPQPIVVEADPMRMAQVFSNLLNNAAKYTQPGGWISIEARRDGESAVVKVTDNGIGIRAQALSTIFDMFTQADVRPGEGQTGLGIGLTLVRSLVDLHGGSVSAASPGPGRGSEFAVRLPLGPRPAFTEVAPAGARPQVRALPRIMVVDDNRDAADSLGALLELLGAEVRVVHDGPAALEAFSSFHPRVVLLDLGMPGMDGFEVARRIRERADSRETALIALTGWGQERDRRLTEAAGFNHHLIKPADIEAMQAVLASINT